MRIIGKQLCSSVECCSVAVQHLREHRNHPRRNSTEFIQVLEPSSTHRVRYKLHSEFPYFAVTDVALTQIPAFLQFLLHVYCRCCGNRVDTGLSHPLAVAFEHMHFLVILHPLIPIITQETCNISIAHKQFMYATSPDPYPVRGSATGTVLYPEICGYLNVTDPLDSTSIKYALYLMQSI